jgi:multisubunit Na+/H+ antiporter MnhB subunit
MDQPTLIGTGFVILGGFIWILCAYYCYQVAPRFQRRAALWGILGLLFGPLALMALYVLPKGSHISDKGRGAEPGHPGTKKDTQADLYEVPKKHH